MTDVDDGYALLWPALTPESRQELRTMAFEDEAVPFASDLLTDDLRRVTADHTTVGRRVPVAAVLVGWTEATEVPQVTGESVVVSSFLEWVRDRPAD
jgi:hypothetical protein